MKANTRKKYITIYKNQRSTFNTTQRREEKRGRGGGGRKGGGGGGGGGNFQERKLHNSWITFTIYIFIQLFIYIFFYFLTSFILVLFFFLSNMSQRNFG